MAYVAVNGDNFVAVIDLKTWQVTKIQTGIGRRHGVIRNTGFWLSQDHGSTVAVDEVRSRYTTGKSSA
jgi:hypothetical protein